MILADKIITLRKKNNWSQEELAEKLNVSRQSISKWESAASVPDINRILDMSRVFGVSTDYLLKEEQQDVTYAEDEEAIPCIKLAEAEAFLSDSAAYGRQTGRNVALCILSPVLLLILGALSQAKNAALSEGVAGGIGVTVLLLLVALAVFGFIVGGRRMEQYAFYKNEDFELDYGVAGILKERYATVEKNCTARVALGVVLCIVSAVPLLIVGMKEGSDLLCVYMTALLLTIVSGGVWMLIAASTEQEAYQKLLRRGEYDPRQRIQNSKKNWFGGFFWPLLTAIYLGASFLTERWDITWVVWPVGALIFSAIAHLLRKDEDPQA
jgi:transcriptional regulator with XRE-family HTH domain